MKVEEYHKQLKIDGTITFELRELGKTYKTKDDITLAALARLLKDNTVPDGVYVIQNADSKWRAVIYWREKGRYNIKTYPYNTIAILEGMTPEDVM